MNIVFKTLRNMILLFVLRRPCRFSKWSPFAGNFVAGRCNFCSVVGDDEDPSIGKSSSQHLNRKVNYASRLHFSSMNYIDGVCDVKLMDNDTWSFSSCLSRHWQGLENDKPKVPPKDVVSREERNSKAAADGDPDFDEIDMMRVRGDLSYKVERKSKEFEECSIDFYKKKSSRRRNDEKEQRLKKDMAAKHETIKREASRRNKGGPIYGNKSAEADSLPRVVLNGREYYSLIGEVDSKKKRNPTFNQLTGPYHQPFCLDIFITKASIRASVTHRVTSSVVAVAHSISKDMKSERSSTRNSAACVVVGKVLAQRALADDIHDIVYTPRKGEKVEGKLLVVLQSIMDSGVNVAVKIKQQQRRKTMKRSSDL